MRFIDALGTDAQKRRYFAEVVEHGRLFGSWGSEPAVSLSRSFLMETVVRQDRDDYVVDGVKHFCTMALGASHYMVWCALEGGTDMGKALLQVLVPADAPGIATDGKWNTLGMRATFSPSVTFTGVRVAKDAALGDPGNALRVGVVESFALGYAAVYVGIAEGALAFAIDYAKQRIVKPENVPVAHDPTVQRHVGELAAHLDAARLVLADTAERWEAADVQERGVLGNKAKYIAPRSASRSPRRSSRWSAAAAPTRTSRPSAPSATCAPPPSCRPPWTGCSRASARTRSASTAACSRLPLMFPRAPRLSPSIFGSHAAPTPSYPRTSP
jgi:alkylation response protein AidB-like acyl-CoA dehydrogenase